MAQGLAQLPYTRTIPATNGRDGWIAYMRAGSLSVWLLTLLLPFLLVKDWSSWNELGEEGVDFKKYFYVGFAVICAAHLTLGPSPWLTAPFKILKTWSGLMLTIFCGFELLVSPLSLVPKTSAVYAVGTWGVMLICMLYWQSDYRILQRMTWVAGMVAFAWLFFLSLKLGLRFGQAIGGINRNTTGIAGVGAMICCMVYPRREIRWAGVALAWLFALATTSRGSLVALAVFAITYYAAYKGTYRAIVHGLIATAAFGVVVLVYPHLRHAITNDVFMVHDKARGMGSGFTGRVDAWKQAINAFWKNPILGYGFRASTQETHGGYGGIHSGYLKILVETGFVGGFLVIGAVLVEAARRLRLVLQLQSMPQNAIPGIDTAESMRINALVFATLMMTLTLWIYEQVYINLGSIVSVVLFLMLVAPAYVPIVPKKERR